MKNNTSIYKKSLNLLLIFAIILGVSGIVAKQYPSIETHYVVPDGRSYGFLTVEGDVKAPRKKVWNVLTRTDGKSICTHTKDVLKFTITKIKDDTYLAYYLLDYPWPFQDRWQKLLITHDKENFRIFWKRVEGSITRNSGYYNLEENDRFTTIYYRVEFDPGIKYIPDTLVNYAVKIQAPSILKNIRKCASLSDE